MTHQLTVLVGVLVLAFQALWGPPGTAQAQPTCPLTEDDVIPTPRFEYPQPGRTLSYEDDYLFKVFPVPGATGYEWELVQDGAVLDQTDREQADMPVETPDELARGYLRYLGFVWEASHAQRPAVPVGVDGLEPLTAHAVLRDTPEHARFQPGDLRVIVRAEVCGGWSDPAAMTLHLMPTSN